MNITNQYIIQAIIVASNNLRLSSEKIEVISILKQYLNEVEDIENILVQMKKVTELSKLAVKLSSLHEYIISDSIDFLKITDVFKEHSHSLVMEFSNLLNSVTAISFREILDRIDSSVNELDIQIKTPESEILDNYEYNSKQNDGISENSIDNQIRTNEILKQNLILNEPPEVEKNEFDYDIFETTIVKPIKFIEELLKKILEDNYGLSEIDDAIEIMKSNAYYSHKAGFNLIAEMHLIVLSAFKLIGMQSLAPKIETIESIRACLIVIVAAVREKDVDISNYLKRAEHFSIELNNIEIQKENL